jgi:hypothetical protein
MTFDAFAKGLVDRFGQALPDAWRPAPDYQIQFPTERIYREFLGGIGTPPANIGTRAQLEAIQTKTFERKHLFGAPVPEEPIPPASVAEWAAGRYWETSLRGPRGSFLSFPMIGRLADLILRTNPMVRDALALTYSHLFLDEFQDTTQIQYDLVKTIFYGSETIITAVGDNKQQIMRWAMAMEKPFLAYEKDFAAQRTPLFNNYRSSPQLVRIQHILAQALDREAVEPISKVDGSVSGDSCAVWDFSHPLTEAAILARFVAEEMKRRNLFPRDFVLLVRQKANEYMPLLADAFANEDITLRNEAAEIGSVKLQELLSEELSGVVISILRLAMSDRAGTAWGASMIALALIRGIEPSDQRGWKILGRELEIFIARLRENHSTPVESTSEATILVGRVLDFVGRNELAAAYPSYRQGDWMKKVAEAIAVHLHASCVDQGDWGLALDTYEGANSLPLMTIHKSKGLEYDTVIFIGLDDGAWCSFSRDEVEATAGFFVAFTRAKQRVVFTYCAARGYRNAIATLYQLLRRAGVPVINAG